MLSAMRRQAAARSTSRFARAEQQSQHKTIAFSNSSSTQQLPTSIHTPVSFYTTSIRHSTALQSSLSSTPQLLQRLTNTHSPQHIRSFTAAAAQAAEEQTAASDESSAAIRVMTPSQLVKALDEHIVGQAEAKKAVAVAVRNRWRRHQLSAELRAEVTPKNMLLIGPTGCGKTEIARRLAALTSSPFLKVEATKYTEVGFYGKDVDSIVGELVKVGIALVKARHASDMKESIQREVEEVIVEALCNKENNKQRAAAAAATSGSSTGAAAEAADDSTAANSYSTSAAQSVIRIEKRGLLKAGKLEHELIEVDVPVKPAEASSSSSSRSRESGSGNSTYSGLTPDALRDVIQIAFASQVAAQGGSSSNSSRGPRTERKTLTVAAARVALADAIMHKKINLETITKEAIALVENDGIVFLDEIDKICSSSDARSHSSSADASAEGVQRDLLPLVEGTTVTTTYGPVQTDHILFICSGAFSAVKPVDMLPELQGRLPIRVTLSMLTQSDLYKILTVPVNNLIKQQIVLLATEQLTLTVTDEAIHEMARIAYEVNRSVENIGARRLHTVVTAVMDEFSYSACDAVAGSSLHIDKAYVEDKVQRFLEKADLTKYML